MLHLLAAITLSQDYDFTALDDSNLSDLDNATVNNMTILGQASALLETSRAGGGPHGVCYVSLPVGFTVTAGTYGSIFSVKYTVDIYHASPPLVSEHTTWVALMNGSTPIVASDSVILTDGPQPITIGVDTGGASFDTVRLMFDYTGADPNAFIDISACELISQSGGAFAEGDRILSYWDDDTDDFYVEREDNPGATTTEITDGPNLGQLLEWQVEGVAFDENPDLTKSFYEFCDSTTLATFPFTLDFPEFPYISKFDLADHPACAAAPTVCDVGFTNPPIIVHASPGLPSGSVQFTAESSAGTVRFTNRGNLAYSALTNETGLFENLRAGTYVYYAVDPSNCRAAITIILQERAPGGYEPKYRISYYDRQTQSHAVIDIEERNYLGALKDIIGDGKPFRISKSRSGDLNDKFEIIRPTLAGIGVVTEKQFQYLGLFSQDDFKYRISYSNGSSSWVGYLVPSVYQEDYSPSKRYTVQLTASDNIASLSKEAFLDDSGNLITGRKPLLDVLVICLKKTGLSLNIISAVNRFSTGMDTTSADDPLVQAYIDCGAFYDPQSGEPKKCNEVIEMCLGSFGVFIQQVNSKWHIVEVNSQTEPYAYREFDADGDYVGNGTLDPMVDIVPPSEDLTDVIFVERGHTLDIIPAYGRVNVKLNLIPKPSVFPISLAEGWQPNLANSGGIIYSSFFDEVGGISKGIQFTNFNFADGNQFAELLSPPFETTSLADAIEFSFDYKALFPDIDRDIRIYKPLWIRLIWRIKLTIVSDEFYFSEFAGWNQDAAYTENELLITEFSGEDSSFSRKIDLPSIGSPAAIRLEASFEFQGAEYRDFTSEAGLRAIDTVDIAVGKKLRGDFTDPDILYWYILQNGVDGADDDDFPNIIRPDDYDISTNRVIWKIDPANFPNISRIDKIRLFNVRMRFLPNRVDPIEESTISVVNDVNYKEELDYEISGGDIPPDIIQSEIYYNILTLEDGTATYGWARSGQVEEEILHALLLDELRNQHQKPTWRLAGNWMAQALSFISIFRHTIPALEVTLINEEAPGPGSSGWVESGSGEPWSVPGTYTEVEFGALADPNSRYVTQAVENLISGTRVHAESSLQRLNSSGDRIDRFVCILLEDGDIVQRVVLYDGITDDDTQELAVNFTLDRDADSIGFFIENISEDGGTCDYRVDYFRVNGMDVTRYFYANAFERMDRDNKYRMELVQLLPAQASESDDEDDTGGGNTN
jgi:hypothetical protein